MTCFRSRKVSSLLGLPGQALEVSFGSLAHQGAVHCAVVRRDVALHGHFASRELAPNCEALSSPNDTIPSMCALCDPPTDAPTSSNARGRGLTHSLDTPERDEVVFLYRLAGED